MPAPVLWKVQARFIKDLEKYNEWMNEEDYIIAADDDDDEDDAAERGDADGAQEVIICVGGWVGGWIGL